jgi:hypothetical protein
MTLARQSGPGLLREGSVPVTDQIRPHGRDSARGHFVGGMRRFHCAGLEVARGRIGVGVVDPVVSAAGARAGRPWPCSPSGIPLCGGLGASGLRLVTWPCVASLMLSACA